ncbi:MAG: hypothetical protein WCP19_10000, partial [Chloroflexota bacterium]
MKDSNTSSLCILFIQHPNRLIVCGQLIEKLFRKYFHPSLWVRLSRHHKQPGQVFYADCYGFKFR